MLPKREVGLPAIAPCFNGDGIAPHAGRLRSITGSAPRLNRGASSLHPIEREMILRVEGLKKVFRSGESDLVLFENLSFQVA